MMHTQDLEQLRSIREYIARASGADPDERDSSIAGQKIENIVVEYRELGKVRRAFFECWYQNETLAWIQAKYVAIGYSHKKKVEVVRYGIELETKFIFKRP